MRRPRPLGPLVVLLLLGACAQPEAFRPEPLTFEDRTPIRFAVERVEVGTRTAPRAQPSFIEQRLGADLVAATEALLRQRIAAAGGPGRVRAVVTEARITEEPRETPGGLRGIFRREPDRRLTAELAVRIEVLDERGFERAHAETTARRSRTVPAGSGMAERDRIAWGLIRAVVDDLDEAMVMNIRDNLSGFLRL
jgi:hypothetical protein